VTKAEQALLDAALQGKDTFDLAELRTAVLMERLPPEYEQTLRSAVEREMVARDVTHALVQKHPVGFELARKYREEWRGSK
jgi:hypothetical protein